MAGAGVRKRGKYHDLVEAGRAAGYRTELITVEVGSRGMLGDSDFDDLREVIHATRKDKLQSWDRCSIWSSRNYVT